VPGSERKGCRVKKTSGIWGEDPFAHRLGFMEKRNCCPGTMKKTKKKKNPENNLGTEGDRRKKGGAYSGWEGYSWRDRGGSI